MRISLVQALPHVFKEVGFAIEIRLISDISKYTEKYIMT